MAAFTFDGTKVNTEAQHWIRWRLGDTKSTRVLASQDVIVAVLAIHGLVAGSDPVVNASAVRKAAMDVCRGIIATLAQDAEVPIAEVGPVKDDAATQFRKVLEELQTEATIVARPRFANPDTYDPGFIADVDANPDLED